MSQQNKNVWPPALIDTLLILCQKHVFPAITRASLALYNMRQTSVLLVILISENSIQSPKSANAWHLVMIMARPYCAHGTLLIVRTLMPITSALHAAKAIFLLLRIPASTLLVIVLFTTLRGGSVLVVWVHINFRHLMVLKLVFFFHKTVLKLFQELVSNAYQVLWMQMGPVSLNRQSS